jgi:uncharacterized protein (TIGR03083 family)
MEPLQPVYTAALYRPLHRELMMLLGSVSPDDWLRPTVCRGWAVRDIAAHLLDVDIRRLSLLRDAHEGVVPESSIRDHADLVGWLNRLNADWVQAARRMSPQVLRSLLELTGPEVAAYVEGLDMMAPARFPVAWAGETASLNWFDVGRDYTERWHHQQQIRDAVGAPGLTGRDWLFPALALFVRALPHTYRDVPARAGQRIEFRIEGEAGGVWTLERRKEWELFCGTADHADCTVALDQDTAWRLFTKGIAPEEAARRVRIGGAEHLGRPFLGSLAVMA